MGRGGTPAREINFVSLVAYGPKSDSALIMGGYSLWNQAGRFPTQSFIKYVAYIYFLPLCVFFFIYFFDSVCQGLFCFILMTSNLFAISVVVDGILVFKCLFP